MSVLLVEHEPGIRQVVRDQLQDHGLEVTAAVTVAEATAAIRLRSFDVVILNLTSPDGSGLDVLDVLGQSSSTAHVIMLSGSSADADRVQALQRGADDFVVKPFYVRELTARVLGVRRRRNPLADAVLQVGPYAIDVLSRQVTTEGRVVDLRAKEFDLLAFLAARPGHVFSREQLLNAVWSSASTWQQTATVTEHVRRLRGKIEADPTRPEILVTVRGAGYRLDLPGRSTIGSAGPGPGQASSAGSIVHADGRIVFCDRAAADLLGVHDAGLLVGRDVLELVAPTSAPAVRARLAAAAAGQPRRSELVELRWGDGTQVTIAIDSHAVDWHGRAAHRVRLTAALDAPAQLRRLVTGVLGDLTEAVVICDLHYHIRSWNSAAERLFGWAEPEVLGRHVLDVLHWVGDDHDQLGTAWERLEHIGRWHGQGRHVARDGSVAETLASMTLLRDDIGHPVCIVSVYRPLLTAGRPQVPTPDADLATRLRHGIANDELEVRYQPVHDIFDGSLITVEALVRWQHPVRGTIAPAEFLDVAERNGLISDLGDVVLRKACAQAASWRRSGADIKLAVNISARQLADPSTFERVTTILGETGLDPACLWLEVTETALVEELEPASDLLRRLVEVGVGVAIDDFGTGWASLTYLRSFPVHALKIDRSFVAGAGRNLQDTAIIRSIVSLAAELDLFVVAEGIETRAQQEVLKRLGCSLGQGYLYGRPTLAAGVPIERAHRVRPTAPVTDDVEQPLLQAISSSAAAGAATTAGRRHGPRHASAPLAVGPPARAPAGARPDSSGSGALGLAAERIESEAVASLLRALLRVRTASAAVELLQETVVRMGGTVVPAAEASAHALPIDVSLGEAPPTLVEVEPYTVARMQLERLVPRLVEDTRHAVALLRQTERLADESSRDQLTGLANRRVLDRVLPRARTGSVVLIDLDHFKQVNDQHGHAAGDAILRAFGSVLRAHVRAQDTSCRIGGEEFAIVLVDADLADTLALVDRIRAAWTLAAPRPVTFSAGVSAVSDDGGSAALLEADRALYRAKALGRNRNETAGAAVATNGAP